jgi:hypothetical protein
MDSPIILLTVAVLAVSGVALLIYLCYRAVLWAKKSTRGAEFLVDVIGSASVGSALNPAHEIVQEKRRLKRSEAGSGDPDARESQ